MKLNRKSAMLGIAGLGLVGLLAGGVGIAAASGSTPTTRAFYSSITSSAAPDGDGDMSEMMGGTAGMGVGMHGNSYGATSPLAAAASYLGLSRVDLQKQLQAGTSLADIAKAQGKSVSGLEDAMVAVVKKNIDVMVNATHEGGANFGSMSGGMMGGTGR